jgi:hypothetical protein
VPYAGTYRRSWGKALRGEIDNTQRVILDGSPSAQSRVVYSVRRVPEQRLQFGTVKVDYGTVAVWRAYDPDNDTHDAEWRKEPWRNVYRIHVTQHPIPNRPKYVVFAIDDLEVSGVQAKLPVATLVLSYHLKGHLEKL